MFNRQAVAIAAFINVISSIIGFAGYSAAPRLGEPFTSIGYQAFVVWSIALLPIVGYLFRVSTASSPVRLLGLVIGLVVVISGAILQILLSLGVVTLAQTTAWNFASAGGVGLWLIVTHVRAGDFLPLGLAWYGILVGSLWLLAFVLLGAAGFPNGGPKVGGVAAIGFGADATAYFGFIGWATWLGIVFLCERSADSR